MFRVEVGPRRQSHQAPPGTPALAVCAFPASGPPVQVNFATQTTEAPAAARSHPAPPAWRLCASPAWGPPPKAHFPPPPPGPPPPPPPPPPPSPRGGGPAI